MELSRMKLGRMDPSGRGVFDSTSIESPLLQNRFDQPWAVLLYSVAELRGKLVACAGAASLDALSFGQLHPIEVRTREVHHVVGPRADRADRADLAGPGPAGLHL